MDVELELRRFRTWIGATRGMVGSLEEHARTIQRQAESDAISRLVITQPLPEPLRRSLTTELQLVHDMPADGLAPWMAHNERVTR